MEISYLILIFTSFFYGATQFIKSWEDFNIKLINVLAILAIIVLVAITGEDGLIVGFDWNWLNYVLPAGAIILGGVFGEAVNDEDWTKIFVVLAGLGIVATIITACCGL